MEIVEQPARRFRVEHRDGRVPGVRVLGRVVGVPAHHQSLVPFVSQLLREAAGASGEVALVDETTNVTVARRHLGHALPSRVC
jgi:hypothetical protein